MRRAQERRVCGGKAAEEAIMTMGLLASWAEIQSGLLEFFQSLKGWGLVETLVEIFMIFFLLLPLDFVFLFPVRLFEICVFSLSRPDFPLPGLSWWSSSYESTF